LKTQKPPILTDKRLSSLELVDGIDAPLRCALRSDLWLPNHPRALASERAFSTFLYGSCRKVRFRPLHFSKEKTPILWIGVFSLELVDGIEPPTC
jgi:hypothetical protein